MTAKPKSTPELLLDAGEARMIADLTEEKVQRLMERTRELRSDIESRVREITDAPPNGG
jgi:hypothetical protein